MTDYYGAINELKAGLTVTLPEMPEAYKKWRQCKVLGLPLYEGGVQDQPHIWLLEVAVISEVEQLFDALSSTNAGADNA